MTHQANHARGMAIMAFAMMLLPLMDAIAKWLATASSMAPGQVTFLRFALQMLFSALLVAGTGGFARLRPARLWPNLIRGVLLGGASLCFFTAVKYMPLADAMAIFFVEPMILTVLSAVFLREPVGWRRWSAVGVGFVGALIVIQPSFALFGLAALLPLGTATFFATYMLLNRRLTLHDSPLVMQYAAGIGGTALTGAALGVGLVFGIDDLMPGLPPDAAAWSLLLLLGVLATFGHLFVVQAFRHAEASLLAPFQYIEIISATLVGLLVFGDFPSASKWLGIAIIVGSGLYTFWRESRRRERPRPVPKV
ncbi:DMT family transporter [Aquibium sp. A9E412]|uniref:DMT family transporter n=1 Tax=Aquibium sp. A9E412 TaxID=2976767 RepID=UPI0025AF0344|nr:DMT family transporter [Aquibium sp. A9E412]MDN2564763.1 DMT family transporter [Aquibium sp. A9E412]